MIMVLVLTKIIETLFVSVALETVVATLFVKVRDGELKKIDHNLLNEIEGLDNPTSENIAKWFWLGLKKKVKELVKIEIIRPRIGGCVYEGK